ncbi:IS3 family transposase [Marinoscillum sp.]|uniref:IS3 family transposase n=1 Tax=Marinoscillum sp. TaxID=2024838 RepID=UPI003BACF8A5
MTTLKERHQRVALGRLCLLFGITRQSYYQHYWNVEETTFEHHLIINEVKNIRQSHPRMGTRKLYELLDPFMLDHQIMGRDALFNLLADNNLLVKKRKRRVYTTNSSHWLKKYPNLIKEFVPTSSNQLWVSDITYWKMLNGYLYISFITDAYSHKIVGYSVSETLEAIASIKALEMAITSLKNPAENLIHHSDRGIQYCSSEYVKLLQDNVIQISMTENSDPLENAVAERVNGIIKNEYLECYEVNNLKEAQQLLEEVVRLYNEQRPHMSISNKKPSQVHNSDSLKVSRIWKNYYPNSTTVNLESD